MAEWPGVRQRGRITGCISTPMSSSRPKPSRKVRAMAPMGTMRPTDMASLSKRKGRRSGVISQAGPQSATYMMASPSPSSLNRLSSLSMGRARQRPSSSGLMAP
ncbi:hypothetical protein D3C77_454020 [compost metagenome]